MSILLSILSDFIGIVTVLVAIISATVAISSVIDQVRQVRQRDTIVGGRAVPAAPEGPQPEPLTPDEKIDALYQLSKHQRRLQFISNLAWGIFGIAGGFLVGRFLLY
ncbi:MAG: hypothetical protein ACLQUY_21690 [Ktedonobacterales bacterium]